MIRGAVLKVLTPDDELPPPDCSSERLTRGAHVISLPTSFNGLGITPVSETAAVLFWASHAKVLKQEHTLLKCGLAHGLGPELQVAYDDIVYRAGDLGSSLVPGLLPPFALQILDGTYKSNPKAGKLLKDLLVRCSLFNLTQHLCSGTSQSLTQSDVIHSAALTGRAVIYQATKDDRSSRLTNAELVAYSRFFLGLPQLQRGNSLQLTPEFDHATETCPCIHTPVVENPQLELTGNHAMACQASAKQRSDLHRAVQTALAAFAKRAGYKTTLEPKTWDVMRRKLSEEQIRRLFPKSKGATLQARAVYKAKLQNLLSAFETRKRAATPQAVLEAEVLIKQAIDELPASDPAAVGDGKQVLRLDYHFIDEVTGVEELGDVTGAHVSCASYQAKELKNAEARLAQRLAALTHSPTLPDLSTGSPSPILTTVSLRKVEKYQLLIKMAKGQAENKERGAVNFVAFAFSTSGELCPAAEALMERIVQTYRRKIKAEGHRDDGLSVAHLTHLFRFDFNVAIQVAIARGVSKVLTFAGSPLPQSW